MLLITWWIRRPEIGVRWDETSHRWWRVGASWDAREDGLWVHILPWGGVPIGGLRRKMKVLVIAQDAWLVKVN